MSALSEAIASLCPGAEWTIRGEKLYWLDKKTPKPTDSAIQKEINRLSSERSMNEAKAARRDAYALESDPLFFKAQRGEITMEEWKAKVNEIRKRFPYS